MIRAAFMYREVGDSWLGGVSYLRNLLGALRASPECGVEPVVLASRRRPSPALFGETRVVRTLAIDSHHWLRWLWNGLDRDPILDRALARCGADVLSHVAEPGPQARVPSIAWIPDLQHRALPELFSEAERQRRDAIFDRMLREASRVVVSSEAARLDVASWCPASADKLRVLRFVDISAPFAPATPREELERRHGFAGRFFLLPNQYWAHKNHRLVLEALALLARKGTKVQVLSTGSPSDYRQPGFFEGLMRLRDELGLGQSYRVLGVVPFADLAGLLRGAVAVVNPSLFEGWSTSVEEAKSLGKRVLLSDIAVHREQAPERGTYFDPRRPGELAEALLAAWTREDPDEEVAAARRAAEALPLRRSRFAADYAAIARDALGRR